MYCEKCMRPSKVTQTRETLRTRQCTACGHRWQTEEVMCHTIREGNTLRQAANVCKAELNMKARSKQP